ncbi:Membrane protein PM19L [Camellia lanceoleosa]|uniref:Membrane protein PM19L n=1 Tax=Camellia lanceoleosa TaxID=1840588 RepID=A0ACC0J344_9ERIC|nr:Membrane protein PM19L [Camellia lanceoleosa]
MPFILSLSLSLARAHTHTGTHTNTYMAIGRAGRSLMGPLLIVNFVVYLILLGLAGWSLDKYVNGQQNHPHLGGNEATSFMLAFALLGGVVGACSVLAALMHLRAWSSDSLSSASSSAIISWAITVVAFGLVCKEITMGGHRGKRLVMRYQHITCMFCNLSLYINDCSKHWKHLS